VGTCFGSGRRYFRTGAATRDSFGSGVGQRLQYIIVEGESEGLEAMTFLKRESLGREVSSREGFEGWGREIKLLARRGNPFLSCIS